MKPCILVTDRFSLTGLALLKAHFDVKQGDFSDEDYKKADALIIRSRTEITCDFLNKTPQLKLIISSTSGYDHIDLEETQKRKITVSHTPDANAQSTAELTWLLLLAVSKQFSVSQKMILSQNWNRSSLKGIELGGKNLGIVGLGRVGSRVAKIGQAFGMNVYAYDPYKEDKEFHDIERVGYTELLRMCHITTYHVPYTKETHRMLNRNLFEDMLDGMIVINACRGEVMNEQDLLYGLETGKISRLGLDVFSKEPLDPKSNLFTHPNVVCTPHIGATTETAFESSSIQAAQKCIDFFSEKKLEDQLPYDKPWWNYTFRRS